MPKKKLLMILGAGSSQAQGLPSVGQVDAQMTEWARALVAGPAQIFTNSCIITRPTAGKPNYFELAWVNRERYFAMARGNPILSEIGQVNYERVLGDMHSLLNGFIEPPLGDPIFHLVGKSIDANVERDFSAVGNQIKCLCARLAAYIRDLSFEFEKNRFSHGAFQAYQYLFSGLRDEFDLGVYTLNYDTVALNALPGFFTGFGIASESGYFQPHNVHQRPEWQFLYHLHGSVHHSAEPMARRPPERRTFGEIIWEADLQKCEYDRGDLRTATDNRRMVPTTLVAGGWKLDQIQEDPFQTFYSTLPKHAHEADAILICGYGFGDAHVNAVLQTVMLNSRSARPPVVVLGRTGTPQNLAPTLIGLGIGWRDAGLGPQFEVPMRYPDYLSNQILIWRGGFENAVPVLPTILNWLNRAQIT